MITRNPRDFERSGAPNLNPFLYNMSEFKSPRVLLVSVGGSPNPILTSIADSRPERIWYVCSETSKKDAESIQREISDPRATIERKAVTDDKKREAEEEASKILARMRSHPDFKIPLHELLVLKHHEELGPCYAELHREIPRLLTKYGISASEVHVDYTGGTKTMSAALVLASVEHFQHFSYVGGFERDKGGVGDVKDGKQKTIAQPNPWSALAIREVERARDLWNHHNYDAAARVLHKAAERHTRPTLFKTIASLAEALAARHRLDFSEAIKILRRSTKTISTLFEGRDNSDLLKFVESTLHLCLECSGTESAKQTLLNELLDNTLRTAAQNRFEDAAARLYRCMEMQLQIWLEEKTGGIFKNGKTDPEVSLLDLYRDLPALQTHTELQPHRHGGFQLGLEAIIHVLGHLQDPRVAPLIQDLRTESPSLRNAAQRRNKGILAHGTKPVCARGFGDMKTVAEKFFGFALSRERNPIPPLDPGWLDAALP